MLSSIAEKLWGSQVVDEDAESPGKSTTAGGEEDDRGSEVSGSSELICSLWEVDGNDAREAVAEALVVLEKEEIVLEGTAPNGETVKREFRFSEIVHFHQHEQDIYQWIVKKSGEEVEEFGVVFRHEENAKEFGRLTRPKLREAAEVACRQSVAAFQEYDRKNKVWQVLRKEDVTVSVLQRKDFEAYLVVSCEAASGGVEGEGGEVLSEVGISQEEYIFPQSNESQLTWWGPGSEANQRQMFSVKFTSVEDAKKFFKVLDRVLREHSAGRAVSASDAERDYDEKAFDMEVEKEEVAWMDAEEVSPEAVVCKDTTRELLARAPSSRVHKLMYVGSKRTFVVRGSAGAAKLTGGENSVEMEVLKFDSGKEEVVATLDGRKLQYNGKRLCPTKALLHNGEEKLLMVDEGDAENVYMMDVEKEAVVQSWKTGEGMKVQNLIPTSKGAEATGEATFLCTNPKAIFTMDTRCGGVGGKGGEAATGRTTTISYATNVQFTAGATDEKGHILMGSKTGDMRLYDGEANREGKFKRAKTHLQGLADPLLHVSVTRDGSWILGTCAKYLVLYPVKLATTGKTGFVSALGKSKPPPIVLKVSMEDMMKYNLQDLNFSKAEFNEDETAIVTSTGNLAIVWDFGKAVAGGGVGAYTIRAVDEYIKDVDFVKTKQAESIVVATPCAVTTKPIFAIG